MVPGLALPQQAQGSLFGGPSQQQQQQQQSQPHSVFGSAQPPSAPFNFANQASGGGGGGLGAAPNLNFPSNTGSLNFAASAATQGVGLGGVSQASENKQQGFQFDPAAGVNFNFGGGQSTSMGHSGEMLFSAGSSQSSSAPSSRIIKKARRRFNK